MIDDEIRLLTENGQASVLTNRGLCVVQVDSRSSHPHRSPGGLLSYRRGEAVLTGSYRDRSLDRFTGPDEGVLTKSLDQIALTRVLRYPLERR